MYYFGPYKEYDGELNELGERDGKGTVIYGDGSKYYGEFYKGKKNGYGKYTR